ncbi:hypothetical protein [Halochromatium roseum]|uniref:hypothetical protein n=1 Tax=Halochromatium roseum TaxID=391920 RepID=UPI00191377C1|nr:hypothetical protein [Halochromatium roseum]MBK5940722.1 hypothetical protein [Halochromatium roseum]
MVLHLEKQSNRFLLLFLLADLVFILVHIGFKLGLVTSPLFSIEEDLGYAEVYQYIKEYWIVLLLLTLAIGHGRFIYFAWSLLFAYLLFDDSLQIHERLGGYLANALQLLPILELRAQDLGELVVTLLFGTLLFAIIGIAYLYADHIARQASRHLFALVLFLALFGVFVDMLHSAIHWGEPFWLLIEDGGEMLIMSVIAWYVFQLGVEPRRESPDIVQLGLPNSALDAAFRRP